MEAADEVLAFTGVDSGLSADGRVDHAEQRGRQIHQGHPAQPGGGDEPGQIGGRSTADRDDGVGPGETGRAEDDQQWAATSAVLAASPSGTSIRTGSRPAVASAEQTRSARLIKVGGWITATCSAVPGSSAGSSASRPRPTSTG